MTALEGLQAAAAAVTALTILGGGAWWVLRPRFVELVRATREAEAAATTAARQLQPNSGSSTRDALDRVEAQAEAHARRLADVESTLGALSEGMSWSGRVLDNLAAAVDRIGRLQQEHLAEARARHRRFDPDAAEPWNTPDP